MITSLLDGQSIRVIDVGARGDTALPFLNLAAGQVELTGFEPDRESCDELNRRKTKYKSFKVYPYAIGRQESDRDFYVTQLGDLASLLKPSAITRGRKPFHIKEVVKISTTPLDTLVEKGELTGKYDLLKLDTQGSELEILNSGDKLLNDVLCVVCETEFFEMYENQPRFSEVEVFLRSKGFEPLSLNQHSAWSARHGFDLSRRKLTWGDSIFVKRGDYFQSLQQDDRFGRIRKLVFFLVSLGYFGEAYQLSEKFFPSLVAEVSVAYKNLQPNSLVWRLKLLVKVLACVVNPTRQNRVSVARKVLEIKGEGQLYYVSEIGKI
jgi:FkbM family methyltransferase